MVGDVKNKIKLPDGTYKMLADGKTFDMFRDIHAFKWGFLATLADCNAFRNYFVLFLKNKYVVTPEGKPLGGLPSKNESSDYEEGEAQKLFFLLKH